MAELTPKRKAFLDKVEREVERKRTEAHKAYEQAMASDDPPAMLSSEPYAGLYKELVALREKRNEALARYRSEGFNI